MKYHPLFLRTLRAIADAMGVSPARVRQWAHAGAPILQEGQGKRARYMAEAMQLWEWRRKNPTR